MQPLSSINSEQRLYVLKEGNGFTCLGFDVARNATIEAARRLNRPELEQTATPGTEQAYRQYCQAMTALANANLSELSFSHDTPQEVRSILSRAAKNRQRLRVWYGDRQTGESWGDENDILGIISNSTGPIRIPIILTRANSSGGPGVLDSSIVAIADAPGHFIYKHATFSPGTWEQCAPETEGYAEAVKHNGKLHAQFKKAGSAARYIAFMTGASFDKRFP